MTRSYGMTIGYIIEKELTIELAPLCYIYPETAAENPAEVDEHLPDVQVVRV